MPLRLRIPPTTVDFVWAHSHFFCQMVSMSALPHDGPVLHLKLQLLGRQVGVEPLVPVSDVPSLQAVEEREEAEV